MDNRPIRRNADRLTTQATNVRTLPHGHTRMGPREPVYRYERGPINWWALCLVSITISLSIGGVIMALGFLVHTIIGSLVAAPFLVLVMGVVLVVWKRASS